MPRPPGIIDRVNFVVDTWNNPCDAPWAVYVELAKPAVLQAFVAIVCFGFLDVVRFIFRPSGSRLGRHSRPGKKGERGRKKQGLGNKLRSKIPPLAALANRKVTNGVKTLWVIDGIGQRLLWWWLVADVASGTLYNFTSMLYKTEFCQNSGGPGAALREDASTGHLAVQGWSAVGWSTLDYQRGTASAGVFSFTVGNGDWSVVGAVELENRTDVHINVEIRVKLNRALGTEFQGFGNVSIPPHSSGGLIGVATWEGSLNGSVEVRPDTRAVFAVGGSLFVHGRPPIPPPPVKFNCFGFTP